MLHYAFQMVALSDKRCKFCLSNFISFLLFFFMELAASRFTLVLVSLKLQR